LTIKKVAETEGIATIELQLTDGKNILCLDAANWVRFGIAGDGELMDNLGTSSGARLVQLYNGRAIIRVKTNKGRSVVTASSEKIPTAFINL
jgi:beta-galactosidase